MKNMDKYQKAIIEYASAGNAIKQLNIEIANSREDCWQKQIKESSDPFLIETINHLDDAYSLITDDDGSRFHRNGDPVEYLAGVCHQCLHTHNLIQERKEAKKRFAMAKRRITILGKELCKTME